MTLGASRSLSRNKPSPDELDMHDARILKAAIYTILMDEARWGAVSPGSEWSIPLFHADFLGFTLKSVLV
jgi:hypothetical protein